MKRGFTGRPVCVIDLWRAQLKAAALILTACSVSMFVETAGACSVRVQTVTEFLADKSPNKAVFVGTVTSVKKKHIPAGQIPNGDAAHDTIQDIQMKASRWFVGTERPEVMVSGKITGGIDQACAGVFDFSAAIGEQWLVFGRLSDGKITPNKFRSEKLIDGKIPDDALAELLGRKTQGQPELSLRGTPPKGTPQELSSDRPNAISRNICIDRECQRSDHHNLPFCQGFRAGRG